MSCHGCSIPSNTDRCNFCGRPQVKEKSNSMSDLRAPGFQGVSRGHSEPQKNHDPLTDDTADESGEPGMAAQRLRPQPILAAPTKGKKSNPVR